MSPVFDSFADDLDDVAERCASPDAGVRRVAMMELAEAVGPEAKVLLLKGLGDPDAAVRAAAAKALDEHDGADVVEGLVRSLEDADEAVRRTAADTLSPGRRSRPADRSRARAPRTPTRSCRPPPRGRCASSSCRPPCRPR